MRKIVLDGVFEALKQVVFPRFDVLDGRMDKMENKMDGIETSVGELKKEVGGFKEEVGGLGLKVENLENDMYYVKKKVELIENKIDENINMSFVAKDHERRIKKLERVTLV